MPGEEQEEGREFFYLSLSLFQTLHSFSKATPSTVQDEVASECGSCGHTHHPLPNSQRSRHSICLTPDTNSLIILICCVTLPSGANIMQLVANFINDTIIAQL